jgi:hypothetical protein
MSITFMSNDNAFGVPCAKAAEMAPMLIFLSFNLWLFEVCSFVNFLLALALQHKSVRERKMVESLGFVTGHRPLRYRFLHGRMRLRASLSYDA